MTFLLVAHNPQKTFGISIFASRGKTFVFVKGPMSNVVSDVTNRANFIEHSFASEKYVDDEDGDGVPDASSPLLLKLLHAHKNAVNLKYPLLMLK